MEENHPILFYDGHCNLCHFAVRFVSKRDRKRLFYFAPLQGDTAATRLSQEILNVDTVVLLEGNKVYIKSKAAFRVLRLLGFPWNLLCVLNVFPLKLTDVWYDAIARRRNRIWGRREVCEISDSTHPANFFQ
jgi:predicted DCC family thiol-disulfide oxidoreductase YuxK